MLRLLALICCSTIAATTVAFAAPASGIAYDSVTKFMPAASGSGPAVAPPGTFDTDWQTASQPAPSQPTRGGFLGKIQAAAQQAGNAVASFRTGLAQHHYIAGTKERTDNVAAQQATITDCDARTITNLDLKAKTYTVTSMDQPQRPSRPNTPSRDREPQPAATDDGTKYSFSLTNRALGSMPIGGLPTDGYSSDITTTAIKTSGERDTGTMSLTEYFSKFQNVQLVCGDRASRLTRARGSGAMQQGRYEDMMRALAMQSQMGSKYTFSNTGPALPSGRLGLFETITMSGQASGGSTRGSDAGGSGQLTIVTERGNVRTIRSDDAVFSVPADFTNATPPA